MIGLLYANESFMDGFRFFGGPPWPGGAASGLGEQVMSFPAAPGGHPAGD